MKITVASLAAAALAATASLGSAKVYFEERFAGDSVPKRWVQSESKADYGKFKISAGRFFGHKDHSRGLQTSEDNKFYALSAPLDSELDSSDKPLIVQYTVKFDQEKGIDCGGAYIKLLPPSLKPKKFDGDSEYAIMVGPDVCGSNRRVHVILTKNGTNHLIKKHITPVTDEITHLYRLAIYPNQTWELDVDNKQQANGTIGESWDILPPKEIPDADAVKPEDWVDDATISDPDDKKPEDWDESIPEFIPDPKAKKPADWDDDMDGDWEAPEVPNPEFRGKWSPRRIDNPKYKGPWTRPLIANPDYKEDPTLNHFVIGHVGFDLWQVTAGTIFDNIFVGDDYAEAKKWAEEHWGEHVKAEIDAKKAVDAEQEKKLEEERKATEEAEAAKTPEEKAAEHEKRKQEVADLLRDINQQSNIEVADEAADKKPASNDVEDVLATLDETIPAPVEKVAHDEL
ncbi:Calreticulin-domain-containing protein [Ramicandelaber brevisporus]|nr:Calreticulin-domain-containing protein [Ramicandelaber brevisporus]